MNTQEIKTVIMRELPHIIQTDEDIRSFIVNLGRECFAEKDESARRFDRMMDELAEQRQKSDQRWKAEHKESHERWEAHRKETEQRWKTHLNELKAQREASEARWKAYSKETEERWKAHSKETEERWESNHKKTEQRWEAHREEDRQRWESLHKDREQKWEAYRKEKLEIWGEIRKLYQKHESSIGALGARWGLHSEASFRNALKGILEQSFDVKVIRVNEFDDEGVVFGRPEQVELDLIIKNGMLIICEIKSSVSKADMYSFERKARFYERRHGKKASRMIVISPMTDERAKAVAKNLGIVIYSYAEDVESI